MNPFSRFKCPYCGTEHYVRYQTNKFVCNVCDTFCQKLSVRQGLTYGDIFGYDVSSAVDMMSPVDYYEGDPKFSVPKNEQKKEEKEDDKKYEDFNLGINYSANYTDYWDDH